MKLNEQQIKELHYRINAKQIPFTEVRDEVLDHYQTALEMEQERPMEEVLAELDKTFTISYCKEVADNYIKGLRSEYPSLIRRKFLEMFEWRRLPLTLIIFSLGLSIPYLFPDPKKLVHLVNAFILIMMSIESLMIEYAYPKKSIKHHYRIVDDKPRLARLQSRPLRGWGIFPAVTAIFLMVPLFVIYLGNLEEGFAAYLFTPPYIYSICFLTGVMVLFQIANFKVSQDRMKPFIR
ncbi:hypothetical protein MMU07_07215 [Aquiflexum sp. LQ15W]|uniref:hypothetical protein n=1 Tax=Cognataquiflexum nitidum TaxID=2922272 RepID=UPI001F135590|nr:hypothetical protein [Cognataquiflexum nitidum]MCH6199360.1 hypothetical protein [Cognataquiflexum nitidum]